uniref:Cation/H+ exchanger transmembrane domain-containing protein n=1 Tax=Phytophthora ramorum TaxID=164328 RepID=H3GEB2_PHYRM
MCKNSNIKGYPAYEITLLFLYAYGSYALAEVMKLSGIMSLFFCGIIMAHYNSYNLSKPSQVTAEHIFKSFALVSEFFVFLYMGMARLFNTFPLSWIANQGRTTKIPAKMQVVLWFSGLRGAIAFALSQNMPGPNQDLYVTTTLSVCIFTTIICGGMTEPLLTYTRLKREPNHSEGSEEGDEEEGLLSETISDHDDDEDVRKHPVFALQEEKSGLHSFWSNIDERYMKPIFGGSVHGRVFI